MQRDPVQVLLLSILLVENGLLPGPKFLVILTSTTGHRLGDRQGREAQKTLDAGRDKPCKMAPKLGPGD